MHFYNIWFLVLRSKSLVFPIALMIELI